MAAVDTWSVKGILKDPRGFSITSYGHRTKESAAKVAEQIKLLCEKVSLTHSIKGPGTRARWSTKEYEV